MKRLQIISLLLAILAFTMVMNDKLNNGEFIERAPAVLGGDQ